MIVTIEPGATRGAVGTYPSGTWASLRRRRRPCGFLSVNARSNSRGGIFIGLATGRTQRAESRRTGRRPYRDVGRHPGAMGLPDPYQHHNEVSMSWSYWLPFVLLIICRVASPAWADDDQMFLRSSALCQKIRRVFLRKCCRTEPFPI